MTENRFSNRRGYTALDAPITVREGAPEPVRTAAVHFALDAGMQPAGLRSLVLRVLDVPPEPDMWSNEDNMVKETQRHLGRSEWFEVYDVAEAVYQHLHQHEQEQADRYAQRLNKILARHGVGWKLEDGVVEARGSEAFEAQLSLTKQRLEALGLTVARREIHEALLDLSRRPTPDLTGSVQHAAAALECVAREVTERRTSTLGQILKAKGLFPPPLGEAIEKIWGFCSERARHVREDRDLSRDEAEMVVGLTAVTTLYLCRKLEA